jgi:hypothetical protein
VWGRALVLSLLYQRIFFLTLYVRKFFPSNGSKNYWLEIVKRVAGKDLSNIE